MPDTGASLPGKRATLVYGEVVVPLGVTFHGQRFKLTLDVAEKHRFKRRHVYPQGSLTFWALGPFCLMTKKGDWR